MANIELCKVLIHTLEYFRVDNADLLGKYFANNKCAASIIDTYLLRNFYMEQFIDYEFALKVFT